MNLFVELIINIHNPFYNNYKGFFVYAIDGSDEKLPDYPEATKHSIFIVHQNIENLAWEILITTRCTLLSPFEEIRKIL